MEAESQNRVLDQGWTQNVPLYAVEAFMASITSIKSLCHKSDISINFVTQQAVLNPISSVKKRSHGK